MCMSKPRIIPALARLNVGEVETLAASDESSPPRFEMLLYSGAEVPTIWGEKMIIDLKGMKPRTTAAEVAILREHNREKVVGVSESVEIGPNTLRISGPMLTTEEGTKITAEQSQGVSFQASMGVFFQAVEELNDKTTRQVNGRTFTGPGLVVTESELMEGSFCVLGRDRNTSSRIFQFSDSDSNEVVEVTMPTETPDAAAFLAAFPNHSQFALEQLAAGADLATAQAAHSQILATENAELRAERETLTSENATLRHLKEVEGGSFSPSEHRDAAFAAAKKPIDEATLTVEQLSTKHWEEKPELRHSFATQAAYEAYLNAEDDENINISIMAPGLK